MSGPEFRAEQLKDPRIADIRVVMMTGDARADQKAASLGVSAYLPKPVRIDELLAAVRDPG